MAADPASQPAPTVVVVGAGIAGLSAAWELTSAHPRLHVIVLDGAPVVGGKLALVEVGGLTVDAGAEALLARRPEALELAREVGLGADLTTPTTTSAGVWSRGLVSPLPPRTLMGIPAWSRDALGVLTTAEARLIDAELDDPAEPLESDIDVATYVGGRVGWAVVDRLVEPLLGGVYAGHASQLSLQATVPAVWDAARAGHSLVAAARAAAERVETAGVPSPVFAGIRGGVGRLPIAVAEALRTRGVEVRTGLLVRALRLTSGVDGPRWQVVTGSRADERLIAADAVVLATPAGAASRLLASLDAAGSPSAAELIGSIETASMALVTAVIPGAAGLVAGGGSGFLVPPIDGRLIKAATYSSAKWGWLADQAGDDLVVRLSVGRLGEEAVLQRDDAELVRAGLADLALALGGAKASAGGAAIAEPLDSRVVRWGGGLPQYAVGHVDRVGSARAAVGQLPGLRLCGAYLDGLGVPATIASGRRAARELWADLARLAVADGQTMTS